MATIEQPAEIKQTRAPGTPSEAPVLTLQDKRPDVSRLEKFAGKAYKDSMTNWNYYVKSEWKKQSEEAVAEFGDNPAQLQIALEKIRTGMLPEDTPAGIRNQFMEDTYYDSASIMTRALTKRKKLEKEDTAVNAKDYADGLNDSISTDFYNVLTYNDAEPAEKRPIDLEIYNNNKDSLAALSNLTDDEGVPYFSENEAKQMQNPADAIMKGFNSFVAQKSLPALEQWEQDKFNDKDTFMSDTGVNDDIYAAMRKSIDFYKNIKKREETKAINEERINNSLSFMDNPIIYTADMSRAKVKGAPYISKETEKKADLTKKIDEKAHEIYTLSDKVGDGKVDPQTLQLIIRQVASITVDNENPSIVDDNILKAYEADAALRKAGADEDQLTAFHQLTARAMTDTSFKQSVAALANKPSFDTMFRNIRKKGTPFSVKTADTMYVEKLGRQAYLDTIYKMIEAETPEDRAAALAYYDSKVQEAYDFIKQDIIDVNYVKNALANQGYAMVELNGNMSKIVGRLPNGEYIIEETGDKINGGI